MSSRACFYNNDVTNILRHHARSLSLTVKQESETNVTEPKGEVLFATCIDFLPCRFPPGALRHRLPRTPILVTSLIHEEA